MGHGGGPPWGTAGGYGAGVAMGQQRAESGYGAECSYGARWGSQHSCGAERVGVQVWGTEGQREAMGHRERL